MFTEDELVESEQLAKPPAAINPFGSSAPANQASNALAATDQSRAIAETQAAMVIAKRFPRDQLVAVDRILNAFARPSLAESAMYSYSRGGTEITGPSIRAAETLAQLWGNVQFGVRELEQRNSSSTVEAFAWDLETNTRQVKVFQVPHMRYTKSGSYRLEDPRDVYEVVANQGARRLRACILGILPGDVVEAAMKQADLTLHTTAEVTPERLKNLVEAFAAFGVPKEAIEKRIQRRLEAMTPALLINLGKIHNSLRDGMSAASNWFDLTPASAPDDQVGAPPKLRGAAALKKAATERAPAEAPVAGPLPPQFTYAEIAEKMHASRTDDELDLAWSLVPMAMPQDQRVELADLVKARRMTLESRPGG